jgi:2'-5' RNA ligase
MVEPPRKVIGNLAIRERVSFRLTWLISSAQLRLSAGRALHSLPPSSLYAPLHYTVVIRPPAHIVTSVVSALERLREISPHHYYHPADIMHVTVGSVRRFLSDGSNVAVFPDELRAIIRSYPSFDLTLRGLNVSPFTVFAQVIPHSRTLRTLRTELRMLRRQEGGASGFGNYVRDLIPHMNTVRFSGRVTAEFLDEVSRYRQVWFGRWTVREVEVRWFDTLRPGKDRQVLERVPLGPIHPTA